MSRSQTLSHPPPHPRCSHHRRTPRHGSDTSGLRLPFLAVASCVPFPSSSQPEWWSPRFVVVAAAGARGDGGNNDGDSSMPPALPTSCQSGTHPHPIAGHGGCTELCWGQAGCPPPGFSLPPCSVAGSSRGCPSDTDAQGWCPLPPSTPHATDTYLLNTLL